MRFFVGSSARLTTLDEATAYSRCHRHRSETIRVLRVAQPKAAALYARRGRSCVSGEQLRRRFEELLDGRQPP